MDRILKEERKYIVDICQVRRYVEFASAFALCFFGVSARGPDNGVCQSL
jgi:hypothetical protein